jgi:hypothetical protein
VYTVHVLWDAGAPPSGEVFDVRKARGDGPFQTWLTGSSSGSASFTAGKKGTVWHVEAMLRKSADPGAASDWSPDAPITAG